MEPSMEDCMEGLGEVGDKGGEAVENAGDVGRMVVVGDGGTASVVSSSWFERKIWLMGLVRRLGKVFFPAREAIEGVVGPAFSPLLDG
jgi:hypothetical protein